MMENTRETELAQITVTSRIPDFWEDQPRTCFIQAESVLYNQKLSDAAKYHLVIAKLGKHVVQQVTDILVEQRRANMSCSKQLYHLRGV